MQEISFTKEYLKKAYQDMINLCIKQNKQHEKEIAENVEIIVQYQHLIWELDNIHPLFTCPVNYDINKCSSKEYGLTCDTCFHTQNNK